MKIRNILSAVLMLMAAVALLAQSPRALAATLQVDNSVACSDVTGAPYCTIQAAIDAANPGDTITIAAGTYTENLTIAKRVRLVGAGSDTDPVSNTIVTAASAASPVVNITGTGLDASNRLELRDLRLTGGSEGAAITGSGNTAHFTFDNVAAINNTGSGIHVNHTGNVADIVVNDALLSNNGNSGFRIATAVTTFDGLTMTNTLIQENGIHGLITGPSDSIGVTSINISDTQFIRNGVALPATSGGYGDLSFFQFNGNATLTNITITGSTTAGQGAAVALQLRGANTLAPIGTVSINGLTITGRYFDNRVTPIWIGSGLMISGYTDLSNLSLNNVNLNLTPATSALTTPVFNLYLDNLPGTALDLGNMVLGGQASGDITNISTGNVDATSATFTSAADNFAIEDRITHAIDLPGVGLVTRVPNNVYVTPNSYAPPTTTAPSIQRAVDAVAIGGTVNIAAGTFVNEFTIAKNLTMVGQGATTIIQSPTTLTQSFVTSQPNKPIILVQGASNVTLRDFTVDGLGRGNSNTRFTGVAYVNAAGLIDNLTVQNITDTPFSGVQHGLAIYAYANDTSPRTLTVQNSTVTNFQKNGITVVGVNLTANVTGNTVSDMSYTPGNSASTCVLVFDSVALDASDNTLTDCQVGVYHIAGSGTYTGNTVSATTTSTGSPYIYGASFNGMTSVTVTGNTFTSDGDTDSYGIVTYAGYNGNAVTATITGNLVQNWDYGIYVDLCVEDPDTVDPDCAAIPGTFTAVDIHFNRIVGNTTAGLESTADTTVDAENNWWGCNAGPGQTGCDATVQAGGTGSIDAAPWLVLALAVNPGFVNVGNPANLTATLTTNSAGATPTGGSVPDSTPATFATTDGAVTGATTFTAGVATDTLDTTGVTPLPTFATLSVTVDNQTVQLAAYPILQAGAAGPNLVYLPIVFKAP